MSDYHGVETKMPNQHGPWAAYDGLLVEEYKIEHGPAESLKLSMVDAMRFAQSEWFLWNVEDRPIVYYQQ